MPRPFTLRKAELPHKMVTANQIAERPLYPRVEIEQRTHSGDEIERIAVMFCYESKYEGLGLV